MAYFTKRGMFTKKEISLNNDLPIVFILQFFIVLSFYRRTKNNTNVPITDTAKRRLRFDLRRRFLFWYQSKHFTAKPPAKKQVFVQYPIGGA